MSSGYDPENCSRRFYSLPSTAIRRTLFTQHNQGGFLGRPQPKDYMKRQLRQTVLVALLATAWSGSAQNQAMQYWKNTFQQQMYGKQNVSYKVDLTFSYPSDGEYSTISHAITVTKDGIYNDFGGRLVYMSSDTMYIIDTIEGCLSYGALAPDTSMGGRNLQFFIEHQNFENFFEDIPYYLHPSDTGSFRFPFESMCDTVVGGIAYKKLIHKRQKWFYVNPKSNDTIPIFETFETLVNRTTNLVDFVFVNQQVEEGYERMTYSFHNLNFGKPVIDKSLYSFDNPQYKTYPRYNYVVKPSPSDVVINYHTEDFDKFLHHPIVSVNGDTTDIYSIGGWRLVDVWSSGCTGCVRFSNNLAHEQDSLGYRVLEHNGIRIVCAYTSGGMTPYQRRYAQDHRISDIVYSAPGILDHLIETATPTFILLSPNNEVVFRKSGYEAPFNEEILRAMKKYQQK